MINWLKSKFRKEDEVSLIVRKISEDFLKYPWKKWDISRIDEYVKFSHSSLQYYIQGKFSKNYNKIVDITIYLKDRKDDDYSFVPISKNEKKQIGKILLNIYINVRIREKTELIAETKALRSQFLQLNEKLNS